MSIRTEFGASEGENPPGRGSDCNPPSPSDAETLIDAEDAAPAAKRPRNEHSHGIRRVRRRKSARRAAIVTLYGKKSMESHNYILDLFSEPFYH